MGPLERLEGEHTQQLISQPTVSALAVVSIQEHSKQGHPVSAASQKHLKISSLLQEHPKQPHSNSRHMVRPPMECSSNSLMQMGNLHSQVPAPVRLDTQVRREQQVQALEWPVSRISSPTWESEHKRG